jgi:hypothetical protein
MRLRIVSLLLLAPCLATAPAHADSVYDNGPINGTTNAWEINFGHVVSNSFIVADGGATIDGLSFGVWILPGLDFSYAEVSITSSEFGGTTYFDQFVNFTTSDCSINQLGWQVCTETGSFSPVGLPGGNYWLNLQNAQSGLDDPAYWDENSGRSQASENSVGTIPSEAFTLFGSSGTGTTPEPSSIMLFGSGTLGLAAVLRRKLS